METVTEKKTPEISVSYRWENLWSLVCRNVNQTEKRKTVSKAGNKKQTYLDRVQPDLILQGWRGWWKQRQRKILN